MLFLPGKILNDSDATLSSYLYLFLRFGARLLASLPTDSCEGAMISPSFARNTVRGFWPAWARKVGLLLAWPPTSPTAVDLWPCAKFFTRDLTPINVIFAWGNPQ